MLRDLGSTRNIASAVFSGVLPIIALASTAAAYTRADLLAYLAKVGKEQHVISAQHTKAADSATYAAGIENYVEKVHKVTGIWVGIYSTDLGIYCEGLSNNWWRNPNDLVNRAKQWTANCGIVELCAHTNSPAGGTFRDMNVPNLAVTYDSSINKTVYKAFWATMKQYADYLELMKNAGVPLLWRPFHEMNGDWFWWCYNSEDNQWAAKFKLMWQAMHRYFTVTRGLNNIVWVYSPDGQTRPGNVMDAYPGDAYVDMVGIDFYNKLSIPSARNLATTAWNLLKQTGKPMAFTEVGPNTFISPSQAGNYNYKTDFLDPVKQYFPECVYINPWYDPWSPIDNLGYTEYYNDPWVLNRNELTVCQGATGVPALPAAQRSKASGRQGVVAVTPHGRLVSGTRTGVSPGVALMSAADGRIVYVLPVGR